MLAHYGYKDGSGDYFISIDTDNCDGCKKCIEACPCGAIAVGEDEYDPLRDGPVAMVTSDERKKIRYACDACKPYLTSMNGVSRNEEGIAALSCVLACESGAIDHSW